MIALAPASGRPRQRRDRGRGFLGAVTLALRHPSAWPIALAGFLARGGILLFLLPVVALPTPTGLATAFGSEIIAVAMGVPTPSVVQLVVTAIVAVLGWIVLGSLIGAAADVALAGWAATSDPTADGAGPREEPVRGPDASEAPQAPRARRTQGLVVRVALVRLACHLPLAIVSVWAVARIVAAVYREYISPGDLSVPLPIRVAASVPDAIVLLVVVWLLGEALGGLAARAIVLQGRPAARAVAAAVASLVLHPLSAGVALASTSVALVALVAPPLGGSALAWDRLGHRLQAAPDPPAILAATLVFAGIWLAGLLAAALATTLRSSIWTWHALRVGEAAPIALPASMPATESSAAEA